MNQETKFNPKEILIKLAKLQADVEMLKEKERMLENQQKKITIIDESMAEIWGNEDDEVWNEY